MEAKLIINGKEITLTAEQIEVLGICEKNIFERVDGEEYFFIKPDGKVDKLIEGYDNADRRLYASANYCKNKQIMTEKAKQEVLNRLLWRFSMENGWDDSLWDDVKIPKFEISKKCFQEIM